MDAGPADRDDVGRLRSGPGPVEQVGVIIGHEHAGDQDAEDVEDEDAPKHAADGPGDVPARIFRLGRGALREEISKRLKIAQDDGLASDLHRDELHPLEGEARPHEDSQPT